MTDIRSGARYGDRCATDGPADLPGDQETLIVSVAAADVHSVRVPAAARMTRKGFRRPGVLWLQHSEPLSLDVRDRTPYTGADLFGGIPRYGVQQNGTNCGKGGCTCLNVYISDLLVGLLIRHKNIFLEQVRRAKKWVRLGPNFSSS